MATALHAVLFDERFRETLAADLSFAAQKLTAIARALVRDPDILLLDEPTAGVHLSEMERLFGVLSPFSSHTLSTILVWHHVGFPRSIGDDEVVFDFGQVPAQGPFEREMADRAVIQAFIGNA